MPICHWRTACAYQVRVPCTIRTNHQTHVSRCINLCWYCNVLLQYESVPGSLPSAYTFGHMFSCRQPIQINNNFPVAKVMFFANEKSNETEIDVLFKFCLQKFMIVSVTIYMDQYNGSSMLLFSPSSQIEVFARIHLLEF